MNKLQKLAHRYRSKAEELRTIASGDACPTTQRALVKVANDYDRMAASADAIERTYQLCVN